MGDIRIFVKEVFGGGLLNWVSLSSRSGFHYQDNYNKERYLHLKMNIDKRLMETTESKEAGGGAGAKKEKKQAEKDGERCAKKGKNQAKKDWKDRRG